jgi:hypothetical protein
MQDFVAAHAACMTCKTPNIETAVHYAKTAPAQRGIVSAVKIFLVQLRTSMGVV